MIRFSRTARNSLLAIIALLAIFTAVNRDAGGERTPTAHIPADHSLNALAGAGAIPLTQPKPPRKDLLVGDLDLLGQVDLTKRSLQGDRYEVPLPDGSTAILTLDPNAQKAADKVLAQAKAPMGAIVVMSTDGRLLALSGRRHDAPSKKDHELALSVWAPAASIFKLITASALVEAGVNPNAKTCYHGGLRSVDKSNLVDSPRSDGACNDLGFAVAKSQNALIAKLAHRHLDSKKLGSMATRFGFGNAPSFALDAQPGRIELPADELEFARVSAGFWNTELSPLGGALAANLIAAKGMRVTPRIVAEIRETGRVIPVVTKVPEQELDPEIAAAVAKMMTGTVRYGTAFKAFHDKRGRAYLKDIAVAGKTGSLSRTSPDYLAYSWFVGFAPADDPQVVIAVLLGNSPLWHLKAHTAARLILDQLF